MTAEDRFVRFGPPMPKAEKYNDLIFQLGDMARERLVNQASYPRSMDRVFKAEDAVLARREELVALEEQYNAEDADYRAFLEQQDLERERQEAVIKQWKRSVDALISRSKDLRKKLVSFRAAQRYEKNNLKKAEAKHQDLVLTHADQRTIDTSSNNLKKFRLALMRKQRDLEELEREFEAVLTPQPGQAGAPGILAYRRILEMEDEALDRKAQSEETMADLDAQMAAKEEEIKAAEDYLDQALFLLGEECYAQRVPDPALAPLYPRIDKAE